MKKVFTFLIFWMLALVGGLVFPFASSATVSGTTYNSPSTITTPSVVTTKHITMAAESAHLAGIALQSMASGPALPILDLNPILNAPNTRVNSAGQPINSKGQFTSGAGGESVATARGRAAHDAFDAKVEAKPGWQGKPRIVDAEGNVHIPDALTPSGRPIEYKPRTPSGINQGRRQLKRYERVTGKKGRLLTYEVE